MTHTCNTLCANDARHRVAFRTFLPISQAVFAPTCALTGGVSYAGRAIYGYGPSARDTTSQQQPPHDICPHAEREKTTHLSRKPASEPPFCFFCSLLPWGKAGQAKNSSGVTNFTPEAEERLDEPELELEQPKLGRSRAGRVFRRPRGGAHATRPARKTECALDNAAQPHNEE